MEVIKFPEPQLFTAWFFFLLIVGLTVTAALIDFRSQRIPNWLTVTILFSGFVVNLVRVAWYAGQQPEPNFWGGLLAGFLFSLIGFLLCFGIFFLMWMAGTCGGGDMKLFAAIGAWLGYERSIIVLIGTIILVAVWTALQILWAAIHGEPESVQGKFGSRQNAPPLSKEEYIAARKKKRRLVYAPALAICTAIYLLAGQGGLPILALAANQHAH
jgi:prepilin peptidase CpaA